MTDDQEDASLAERAASGDDRAFAELVGRHKEPLYRLLRRYTGSADEAYEVVHEAFIATWVALGRYDAKRPFKAWLRTIAINKARDRGRRNKVRQLLFGTMNSQAAAAASIPDPAKAVDDTLIERQQTRTLDDAVSRLPEPLKSALVLTAFDGWSQEEAAKILGVTSKAIETRVYRARKLLTKWLLEPL